MVSNSEDYYDVESLHHELYQNFLDQDYENEYFDVIFFVEEKELFAHGHILAAASPVFKEQLLQNCSKRKSIQINDYSYDEFFEFIRLIYYDCFCAIHIDYCDVIKIRKFFVIAKLAIVYEAERITEICKNLIPHYKLEKIFEVIEIALKYSSELFVEIVNDNFYKLMGFNGFINLDKHTVEAFVTVAAEGDVHEKPLFEAIYKWGEYQAMITVEMSEKEKNQLILHQIKDFLPIFNLKFLLQFVVPKGLITVKEANEYKTIEVTIHSGEKSITGAFIDSYGIFEYDELDEDFELYDHGRRCIWDKKIFKRPSKPSELKKMKGCNWYLLIDRSRKLNIKHKSLIRNDDYLIAEMKEMNDEFIFDIELDFEATATRKM